MKSCRLKIYCDFDGTITKNDVWLNSLGKFCRNREEFDKICNDFYELRIGSRECNDRQLRLIENFSLEKFNSYLDEEEIDIHFRDFTEFCRDRGYELTILSAGLEYYIDYILKKEGLEVMYYGCRMIWDKGKGILNCEYIHTDEYCTLCETCKRNILVCNTNDDDNEISVYIGDGISDYCVSGFADIVFAKGMLASHCWKNNITYFDYNDFSDIKKKLIKLTDSGKIKHRQEARLRRRDLFAGG